RRFSRFPELRAARLLSRYQLHGSPGRGAAGRADYQVLCRHHSGVLVAALRIGVWGRGPGPGRGAGGIGRTDSSGGFLLDEPPAGFGSGIWETTGGYDRYEAALALFGTRYPRQDSG